MRDRTARQLAAFAAVALREITWTIPHVNRELDAWRRRAMRIPDSALREDALATLHREHMNPRGAALFVVLPRSRSRDLLRLLVAYQVALDFLDTVTERADADARSHGAQLHCALADALEPAGPPADYWRHRPGHDDGGYLRELVGACRGGCVCLPGFDVVQPFVRRAAADLSVQVLNHITDPAEREAALISWNSSRASSADGLAWFEHTAAATSTVGMYALLAAAADVRLTSDLARTIDDAYHPTICLVCTLMDSFADSLEDAAMDAHSYVAHYGDMPTAVERICDMIARSLANVQPLPDGAKHAVVVAGMIAMYLTRDAMSDPRLRPYARRIARTAGWLTAAASPVTRVMQR